MRVLRPPGLVSANRGSRLGLCPGHHSFITASTWVASLDVLCLVLALHNRNFAKPPIAL